MTTRPNLKQLSPPRRDLFLGLTQPGLRVQQRARLGVLGLGLVVLLLLACADRRHLLAQVLRHRQRVAPHVQVELVHVLLQLALHGLHREPRDLAVHTHTYTGVGLSHTLPLSPLNAEPHLGDHIELPRLLGLVVAGLEALGRRVASKDGEGRHNHSAHA